MPATVAILEAVVSELRASAFNVAVLGGWAEELLGLTPPRLHKDIDLLVLNPDLDALDRYVAARAEILRKRFSHKRAFIQGDTMVELFLVFEGRSLFFDAVEYRWQDLIVVTRGGLPTAPSAAVEGYRRDHPLLRQPR